VQKRSQDFTLGATEAERRGADEEGIGEEVSPPPTD